MSYSVPQTAIDTAPGPPTHVRRPWPIEETFADGIVDAFDPADYITVGAGGIITGAWGQLDGEDEMLYVAIERVQTIYEAEVT